jgi:hypothetical protein
MRGYQHAASPVDAILQNDEVILARELVLVYAVQTTLLRRAAQPIAVWQQTGILWIIS